MRVAKHPLRRTFLFISQVYVPDPAAVGQQMADAAEEMAQRGHRVVVFTADHGYDDPSVKYSRREMRGGVEIRRLRWSSFGKGSIPIRLLGGMSFVGQAILASLALSRVDAVVLSTTPPVAPLAAIAIAALKRAKIKYWIHDLNPDQVIALGLMSPTSWPVRLFNALNRAILRRASEIVVLDRFMAARVLAKWPVAEKLTVLPPWPHVDEDITHGGIPHDANPWRASQDADGRLIVMYSGNHGPTSPLTTLLEASRQLAADDRILFFFVGGGVGKREVENYVGTNVRSLPYQPLATLNFSLSAADIHVVSIGDGVVGIVHPCKVYGAMAVGRPVLLLGPSASHLGDLIVEEGAGWHVDHGDVQGVVTLLRELAGGSTTALRTSGARGQAVIRNRLSKRRLCGEFCDLLERGVTSPSGPSGADASARRV